jgi:hypothetical protein
VNYSYPIPPNSLISRFRPVFSRLVNHQNATVLALPYTGRTSHLRFISTNIDLQKKLGLSPAKDQLIWIEIDRTDYSYSQFLKELSISLSKDAIPAEDDYLTALSIHQQIAKLTSKYHLILIITLNWKNTLGLPDIDRFLALLQKSATTFPLNYLFSIDTSVLHASNILHPSSAIFEKVFCFPTFSAVETVHSLKRIYLSRNLPPDTEIISRGFTATGGIAGFFHSYINLGGDFLRHPSLNPMLTLLKSEISHLESLPSGLITPPALKLLSKNQSTHIAFGKLTLSKSPTSQEINLLLLFQSKINTPVTREEIAVNLWGKLSEEKYSDWAIDKSIYRLRKLLVSNEFRLITVKNLGYQLTDFV